MTTSTTARRLGLSTAVLTMTAMIPPAAWAATATDARLAELERQVQMLMGEIERLKSEAATASPSAPTGNADVPATRTAVHSETPQTAPPPPLLQQPPSPGVSGHPFYLPFPDGRTTGALATGSDKVRLSFSGQINRSINTVDDGLETDVYFVDNENASSRFRFLAESPVRSGTQALGLIEFEFPSNPSLFVNQTNEAGQFDFRRRLAEVGVSNNDFGSIFLGHGWMASDGTSEVDISGVTTPGWSGIHFGYAGMLLTDDDGFATRPNGNNVTVFGMMDNLDGLSRKDRLRYNSPVIGGAQLSGAVGAEDSYDVALRWTGISDWSRLSAAASYWIDNGRDFDGFSASASMLLTDSDAWWDGVSLTVALAGQDFQQRDNSPFFYYGKVAYQQRWFDIGRTGFALNYANYDEFSAVGEDAQMYGIGASQNIDDFGLELYANFNRLTFDSSTNDFNDMTVLQTGAMVRF